MPDIIPVVTPTGAARILTDAVNAAHTRGLTVTTAADLGVIATSTQRPAWELDPRASAVSVLGAVLLAHQPPVVDVDHALAYVFRTRPEFCEGIEDGVSGNHGGAESVDQLFREGWFIGVQMRTLVTTIPCGKHLTRYPQGETCPRCAGVPVARSRLHSVSSAGHADAATVDETADPFQIESPRSLIAELLDALTPSQGLEALADSCRSRAPKLPPDLADDLTIVEHTLREMAAELRGVQ